MAVEKDQMIWLPGRQRLRLKGNNLRVRINDGEIPKPRTMTFRDSLRLGYGNVCDVQMEGEDGPSVLFEVRPGKGAPNLSTPLKLEDLNRFVEVSVDGEPYQGHEHKLVPGSQLEVFDKRSDKRIHLLVNPPSFLLRHPRLVAVLLALAFLVTLAYGTFLQWSLVSTVSRLRSAEVRLGQAETGVKRAEKSASEALGKLALSENQWAEALRQFNVNKLAAEKRLMDSFNTQFDTIREDFRKQMATLSQEDTKARQVLEDDTRGRIETLKKALTQRMVDAYNRAKGSETALRKTVVAGIAATEPESKVFKRVFALARNKVLFIRTAYKVHFESNDTVRELDAFGTGFFLDTHGMAMTARHVLRPWEYDQQLTVFLKGGMAKLVPDSVHITAWQTGLKAHDDNSDQTRFFFQNGYGNYGQQPTLRIVYVPKPEQAEVVVQTPFGLVSVPQPKQGRSDIAVFQVRGGRQRFPAFQVARTPLRVETLDEVMAIGYPFARLQQGLTIPQPGRGIVRRLGKDLLELDTPLHPGVSGGPVVDRAGMVIGMAIAVMDSPVYGMALRAEVIRTARQQARGAIKKEELRLRKLGCNPGRIDGVMDRKTWAAYACEASKMKKK